MPINDLQRSAALGQGLPLAAVFAKGDEAGNETPYFNVKPMAGYEYMLPVIHRIFSPQPTSLSPIYLLGNNPDESFTYWLEAHEGAELLQRCNGDQRVKTRISAGKYTSVPMPCLKTVGDCVCTCVRRARLHFQAPALRQQSGTVARYLATTGSKNDIERLLRKMRDFHSLFTEGLGYAWNQIPFTLSRERELLENGESGETNEHFMLKLEVLPAFARGATTKKPLPNAAPSAGHELGYWYYLQSIFEKHVVGYSIDEFAEYYGFSPVQFVTAYPDLTAVRDMILEWASNNNVPLLATRVNAERKGKSWRYMVHVGVGDVETFSRKLFVVAGVDTNQWRGQHKRTVFSEPVQVLVGKRYKRGSYRLQSVQALQPRPEN